jgi:hypothetical protein
MTDLTPGTDFFTTLEGGTIFKIPNGFPFPEHFFTRGSARFKGPIRFKGVPFGTYTDPRTGRTYQTGPADTAVERPEEAVIRGSRGSATSKLVLRRLALASTEPIAVKVGRFVEDWDVHVGVSASAPTTGTITFTQTSDEGGVFSTTLDLKLVWRFVRRSDGEEKHLDMATMPIPEEKRALVTSMNKLEAQDVAYGFASADRETTGLALPAALTGNLSILEPIYHHTHDMIPIYLQ